jgi:hypothetical protein
MLANLDELKVRYRNEEVDVDQFGVFVEIEAFALIRELLRTRGLLEAEVYELRKKINGLTTVGEDVPYPWPAHDIPGDTFYIGKLILTLYKGIFDEEIDR